ncbi:MAG TPA: 4'-phosphopantetheinyl transferase superfamily protein [Micromonosporaceae bacterium]|nr:4'-phosphopantetheinyl transferase superfamily protein [Micromonosporaceae bacterium]
MAVQLALHVIDLRGFSPRAPHAPDLTGEEAAAIQRLPSPALRMRARASRALVRQVLGRLLGCRPAAVPVVRPAGGRPVLSGEPPEECSFSVSHDRRVLVLAHSPAGCGVDVEDAPPAQLLPVAARFCARAEVRAGLAGGRPRALWAAKESAAKAWGVGLRAGLAAVTFDQEPTCGWAPVRRGGARTGWLTRVASYPGRHLAVTVRGTAPRAVSVTVWRAVDDGRQWSLQPAGRPVHVHAPWLPGRLRRPYPGA